MRRFLFSGLFLTAFLVFPLHFVFGIENPIAEIDRQRALVERFNQDIEREQLKREAEKQAEEKRAAALNKKRAEARISAQFAGLSNKLSGLPEMPSFEGKFTAGGQPDQ